ncbi:MAG: hypothetical protein FJZ96_04730 [Chloroflexi bacterium]|nr:hypothetical protein [Chloroflexota bacterium]
MSNQNKPNPKKTIPAIFRRSSLVLRNTANPPTIETIHMSINPTDLPNNIAVTNMRDRENNKANKDVFEIALILFMSNLQKYCKKLPKYWR